jgi:hypothetical protein
MTVTQRRPSMFRQLIRGAATRIAADPSIPPENREALAQHAEHIIWHQWRELFGGDVVNLRAPDIEPGEREARAQRIACARSAGESLEIIARRERLHVESVRKIARRLGG